MEGNTHPVLCGGTFFTLLLEARAQRTSKRSQYEGEKDGLSQPDVLAGLGKVIYAEYAPPTNRDTFSTNANAYKSCTDNGSNLSFLYPDRVAAFDKRVKTDYPAALKAMCDFTDRFLEVGTSLKKEVWLARALLELIENDISVDDSQEFFICSGTQGTTKETLRSMSSFTLQPLLLGVWHFVVVNAPDNKSGKDTYDSWCPSKDRAERKYTGNMGDKIVREIAVEVLTDSPADTSSEPENATITEHHPIDVVQPELDTDPKRITVINNGTVQNQKFISIETMNGDIHL